MAEFERDEWEKEDLQVGIKVKIVGLISGEKIICKYSEKGSVGICNQPMSWYINQGPDGRPALQLGDWIPSPIYDKTVPVEIKKENIIFVVDITEEMATNYNQMTSSIYIPEKNITELWDDVAGLKKGKIIE